MADFGSFEHWLARWTGSEAARELASDAHNRWVEMCASQAAPDSPVLQRKLTREILPGVAAYQAMLAGGLAHEQALAVMRLWVEAPYRRLRRGVRLLGVLPCFFDLSTWLVRGELQRCYPAPGGAITWLEDSRERLAFEVHDCIYQATFCEYGVPELIPLYCATDDLLAQDVSRYLEWQHSPALAQGGDRCRFEYRRKR